MGKIIESWHSGFLENTSSLDPLQSSFCPGHGTEMVLDTLTDDFCRQLDQDGLELLLLLELTAVLDMVDHDLWAHCLTKVGVCGVASKLFI